MHDPWVQKVKGNPEFYYDVTAEHITSPLAVEDVDRDFDRAAKAVGYSDPMTVLRVHLYRQIAPSPISDQFPFVIRCESETGPALFYCDSESAVAWVLRDVARFLAADLCQSKVAGL